jgi:azurin
MKFPALFLLLPIAITIISVMACGAAEPTPVSKVAPDVVGAPAIPDIPASAGTDSVAKSKRARPHISMIGDAIQFDRARLKETAIYSVTVTFTNASTVNQHNWVLVQPGTKDAVAAAGLEAGEANSWIQPDDDRVIAHTKLLAPGESEEIKFTGQIAGIYQFVCTFPGHSATMFGEFKFLQPGQG